MYSRELNYRDFRPITATRASVGCVNGRSHAVRPGDEIGWARRGKVACCADCWRKWESENREADAYEYYLDC